MRPIRRLSLVLVLLVLAPAALAQTGPDQEVAADPVADPAVATLLLPVIDDFAPPAGGDLAPGASAAAGFEVTDTMKSGVLTPSWRFSPVLAVKARVPLIFSRTFDYWGAEAKGSGLGDISFDAEYRRAWSSGLDLRLQASVKLPTGDHEKTDTVDGFEYATPLGTGSTDWSGRLQLARSGDRVQWLASLIYRTMGESETITDFGAYTETMTTSFGDQVAGSAFVRVNVTGHWWLHGGVAVLSVQDNAVDFSYSDDTAGWGYDIPAAGTVVDVYPGVSYAMGSWSPFVGLRIPAATSWDDELLDESRDTAFVAQVSFNPARLAP